MTSDEAPLRWGGGMQYALQALPRRRLLLPVLALGGLLLLWGCATTGYKEHYLRGESLYKQGKHAEAEKEFREAIWLNPDYAEAHGFLGYILYGKGEHEKAIGELRKAIQLKPDFFGALWNLAYFFGFSGQEEGGAKILGAGAEGCERPW